MVGIFAFSLMVDGPGVRIPRMSSNGDFLLLMRLAKEFPGVLCQG